MGSHIPVEEGYKGNKNKWDWQIRLDKLFCEYKEGVPIIRGYKQLPYMIDVTTGPKEQEFELIDALTTDRGAYGAPSDSILYKALQHESDGLYRLVIYKQAKTSKVYKIPMFAYWGTAVISKNKDVILWETRYFYSGKLDPRNLETRDPKEDARRKNVDKIPSGGLDLPW